MKRWWVKIILIFLFVLGGLNVFCVAYASFNEQINYQGKITDNSNQAISDGVHCFKFRIMDDLTAGNQLWSEEWDLATSKITTASGLFSVLLGSYQSLSSVNFNQTSLYLEVQYDPDLPCDDNYQEVFAPRKRMGTVPAAFEAKKLGGYNWAWPGAIGATTPSTGAFTTFSASGIVSLGQTTITSTSTPQLTVKYDGSYYYTTSVSNAGTISFDATGASSAFGFADNVGIGTTTKQSEALYVAGNAKVTGTGTFANLGTFSTAPNANYGLNATLSGTGKYGTYFSSSVTNGETQYGLYNYMTTASGDITSNETVYGIKQDLYSQGTLAGGYSYVYAMYNDIRASGYYTLDEGIHNQWTITGQSTYSKGFYDAVTSSGTNGGSHTGYYSSMSESSTSRTNTGFSSTITMNAATNIGYNVNNTITTSSTSTTGYGVYSTLTMGSGGTGTLYGINNNMAMAGLSSTAYGVYTTIGNSGTSNAKSMYGEYISLSPNQTGDTAYGVNIYTASAITSPSQPQVALYLNWNIANADATNRKWAIYNASPSTVSGKVFLGLDSTYTYWGTGYDAYIGFDGDSLNIASNLITATDSLELTGGTNGILLIITATGQVKLTDGVFAPVTTNDIDLGTTALRFKNIYQDDNAIHYFGIAQDASIVFDADSLNIKSNLVTATDSLEFTGGTNGIKFIIAATEQIKLTDGVFAPTTTNDIDLGTSSLKFKNAYFSGTGTFGSVAIGATTPQSESLYVAGNARVTGFGEFDGGILSVGTSTGYTIPSGAGTRLMWIPAKGAFRAGTVDAADWDSYNIGDNSFAVGRNAKAIGTGSIATGSSTIAGSDEDGYAIAMGSSSEATTFASIAMGNYAVANGGSVNASIGEWTLANGEVSAAMGYYTTSSGKGSFSVGLNENFDSTTFVAGTSSTIGKGAIALGYATDGKTLTATGDGSIAIGQDVNATTNNNVIAIGENFTNTIDSSFAIGFGGTDLLVTSGSANFQDTNLTTTGTGFFGSVAIGATTPQTEALYVAGNAKVTNDLTVTGTGIFNKGRFIAGIDDNAGTPQMSIDTGSRLLTYDDENIAINWNLGIAYSLADLNTALDFNSKLLYGSSEKVSADWKNRILYDSLGTTAMLDWSTAGTVALGANSLTTTGTGTLAKLVVNTSDLVVNATSYENKVGIGTAAPAEKLSLSGGNFLHTTGTPTIKSTINDDTNLYNVHSVYVSGKYAYVVNMDTSGSYKNFAIIDISNSSSPSIVGTLNDDTNLNNAYSVYVSGKYAYVTNNNVSGSYANVAIVDISNPYLPSIAGTINDDNNLYYAYSIYVSGKYAYVACHNDNSGSYNGLVIYDISNPSSPSIAGYVRDAGNLYYASHVSVFGNYAYITTESYSAAKSAFTIVNVSNPFSPSVVGYINENTNNGTNVYVSGKYAYTCWQDLGNSRGECQVINVSNPASPSITNTIYDSTNLYNPEFIYVSGRYAYVVNQWSTGSVSNFAIIDVSDSSSLSIVGAIDDDTNLYNPSSIYVSGKYAYVVDNDTDGGRANFAIVDISGIDVPAATIGDLAAGTIDVWENMDVKNNLSIGGGLNVGPRGIYSYGEVGIVNASDASSLTVLNNTTLTATVQSITANALTTGVGLSIASSSSAMTSGSLLRVTAGGTGTIATNGTVSITHSGNYASTSNAGLLSVQANATTAGTIQNISGTALTTGVGLYIANGTSAMTSGSLLRVAASGTGLIATNGIVSITHAGVYTSTSNAGLLSVQANATTAGTVANFQANALTTGTNLYISSTGTGLTSGSLLVVTSSTIGAITSNGIVSFNAGGNYTSPANVGLLNVTADSTTAGTVAKLSGIALTSGQILNLTSGTGLTTGSALVLTGASYKHASAETGNLVSISFTDASTHTTGTATTNGLNIASTYNSVSVGAKAINGVFVIAPTLVACGTTGGSCSWNGYKVETAALTQPTTNAFTMNGFLLSSAGALVQNNVAGTINWNGLNVQMPSITQTTGTVTATGIKVAGGTVTSGTAYGLDIAMAGGTQARIGYDASNYYTQSVSSAGTVSFDATGASSAFGFADNMAVGATTKQNEALYVAGDVKATSTGRFDGGVGVGVNPTYGVDVTTNTTTDYNYLRILRNGVTEADGFFKVTNYTSSAGIMAPIFWAKSNSASYPGIAFIGDSSSDTGIVPIVRFQSRVGNGTVTTRPLFSFENGFAAGNVKWTMLANGNLVSGTDGTGTQTITTAGTGFFGSVAIGATTPQTEALYVAGDAKVTGTITSGNSIVINGVTDTITASSGTISFGNENLTTTGNVGVGITPASRLHVVGNATTDVIQTDAGINFSYVGLPPKLVGEGTDLFLLPAEAGNVDAGEHYYYVTYYTGIGETSINSGYPRTGKITTDAGHGKVTITLPVSSDYRVIGRRIYRSTAGGGYSSALYLDQVANNTETTYVDNIADISLGTTHFWSPDTTNQAILVNGVKSLIMDPNVTMLGAGSGSVTMSQGGGNVIVGQASGTALTTGSQNVLIGSNTGTYLTTSGSNVFVGMSAGLLSNNASGGNIAIGRNSGLYVGAYNVAVGYSAGSGNSGNYNILIGRDAGAGTYPNSANYYNVAIGYQAGYALLTAGGYNLLLGSYVGDALTTGSYNVVLGYNIDLPAISSANMLDIGNLIYGTGLASTGTTVSTGKVGIGTTAPDRQLEINTGAATGGLRLTYNDSDGSASTYSDFLIDSNGTVSFDATGASSAFGFADNVGVGTTTKQSEALYVAGNAKVTGTITSGNSIVINGVADTITASSGTISFGNENLSTTGTLAAAHTTIDSTLLLQSGSITDSSGAITFDNENLTTTGTGKFANLGTFSATPNANYGLYASLSGTGKYGIYNYGSVLFGETQYGLYNIMYTQAGSTTAAEYIYGIKQALYSQGNLSSGYSYAYGMWNDFYISGNYTLDAGIYNNWSITGQNSYTYGFEDMVTSGGTSGGSHNAFYSSISDTSTGRTNNGFYSSITPNAATNTATNFLGSITIYQTDTIAKVASFTISAGTITNPSNFQVATYVANNISGTDTGNKKWAFYNASTNTTAGKVFMGIDSVPTYLGTGFDSYILFDGDSLNIVANAITAADALEFTAGNYKFRYDTSNYYTTSVSSAGTVSFDATGASAAFGFADNVGIGTTTKQSEALYVAGNANIMGVYKKGGVSGTTNSSLDTVNVSGGIVIGAGSSDLRLKKDIVSLGDDIFSKLEKINGIYYYWNEVYQNLYPYASPDRQIGLIAQDVQAEFPELVSQNTDGYLGLSYGKFSAVLLEGVKELGQRVEKLELQLSLNNNGSVGDGDSGVTNPISLLEKFILLGVQIKEGVVWFKELAVEKITANEFVAEKITANIIRTDKIEMVDRVSGDVYCSWVEGGELKRVRGECSTIQFDNQGDSVQIPAINPTPEPTPEVVITPTPEPTTEPTPTPTPTPEPTTEPTPEATPEPTPEINPEPQQPEPVSVPEATPQEVVEPLE